jgi:hypothetical protein
MRVRLRGAVAPNSPEPNSDLAKGSGTAMVRSKKRESR